MYKPVVHNAKLTQDAARSGKLHPRATTTGRSLRVDFYSGPFAALCKNIRTSTKPEVYDVCIASSEEDRATATGNM